MAKFSVQYDQPSHGEMFCVMLDNVVLARTPSNTEVDKYWADYIVSALDQVKAMGLLDATEIRRLKEFADLEDDDD